MKFAFDKTEITEEDMISIFPRRIEKNLRFEIWQYPYFDNQLLYNDEDFVIIEFNDKQDIIHVISMHESHLQNQFHLERISNLIHDISANFDFKLYCLNNFADEHLANLFDEIMKS